MKTISPTTRRLLEIQGFVSIEGQVLPETVPRLCLAFALFTTIAATGTILASSTILWALLPIAVLGAALPIHPFDLIYNHGLRYLAGT